MKCYKCKREVPDDARFCPKCGSPLEFTRGLIDQAINNDQPAITQLYDMTKDNVYYTIKTMISDEDTAQDLTQDTFLKAMKYLGQLNEPAAFRGWIKKIARNLTIDVLRKRKVISFSQMVSADSDEAVGFEDDRPENLPEVVIDRRETTRLIGEILGTLSAEQRVVTELFYYEGFSVKEIAEELGVSENTVKSRLKYARNKIEIGVKALEKKGTKLYGLAPIPFLLLLLRSQDAYAAELPDADMLLQSMQSGNASSGAGSGFSGQPANTRSGAGAVSKSIATKIIAGIVATALIGGAIAGIMAYNKEDEPPVEVEEPVEMAYVTARDFEGYYTCPDTNVAFTITPLDDARATVVLEDIFPNGADPYNKEGTAVIDGEMLIMDLETQGGDRATFALSGNRMITQVSRRYQSDVNRVISGTYVLGEKEEVEEKVDIKDYIGTFMNGNNRGAGKLTVTEIDPQSVNVRLEGFRTLDAGEVSTIFEEVGYSFESGIYIDVSGQRVKFTKGTQRNGMQGYILDVPETLTQEWNILESIYEEEYFLMEGLENTPEETSEIDRFLGTYTKDYGSYSYALILSVEEGALQYALGNSYHGGWMASRYTEYSINGNELRATKEDGVHTFILNEDGSITATFSDTDFNNGVYGRNDEYDETEEYPEGYP